MYNQGMLKDGCLKGKIYIVTGGGSGLGKSMTSYLLELGANPSDIKAVFQDDTRYDNRLPLT